ncbi:MAG: molybdopterin-dependent oxidoreductase [Burkholderiales bacterium]|nr:molybdopterin-dependent oxidoreductase [Burkholderiales bacterium]
MKVKTYCYQCVAGPDLLEVEVEDGVATQVTPNFDAAGIHPGGGRVCVKAYGLVQKLYNPNRVRSPMKRTNPRKGRNEDPGFVPISWDEALDIVATKLKEIRAKGLLDESGYPRVAVSFGGGGTPQSYMGTFPAFLSAWGPVDMGFGSGQGVKCVHSEHLYGEFWHRAFTVSPDTPLCEYVISCGANTEASGGVVGVWRHAEARVRGMKRVQVEPHLSVTGACSAEWVPIKPKTDAAFLYALLNVLLFEHPRERLDLEFLYRHTSSPYLVGPNGYFLRDPQTKQPLIAPALEGTFRVPAVEIGPDAEVLAQGELEGRTAFTAFVEHMRPYTPEWAEGVCDVPARTMRRIAREYLEHARVGATIVIDGKTLPLRPVAVVLGKTVNNGWGGYECCWARTMLAALVGALEVPGGTLGTTIRLNRPLADRHASVKPGPDGFMDYPLNPTDRERWRAQPNIRNAYKTLVPLAADGPWSQALGPTHLSWMFLGETPPGLPRVTYPELWFVYRTNPAISFWDTPSIAERMAQFPFRRRDGLHARRDQPLRRHPAARSGRPREPSAHPGRRFQIHRAILAARRLRAAAAGGRAGGGCARFHRHRDRACPTHRAARSLQRRDQPRRRRCAAQGKVVGLLARYDEGAHARGDLGCGLPRGERRTHRRPRDRRARVVEKARASRPAVSAVALVSLSDACRKGPALSSRRTRSGCFASAGSSARRLHEHDIRWWDAQLAEYQALPAWKEFPKLWEAEIVREGGRAEDYPFWLLTSRSMQYAWGGNVGVQLMREVAANVSGHGGVIVNAKRAAELGIAEGDTVEIATPRASVRARAVLRQGIRPDTLLLVAQFDHWATPFAKDFGVPSLNRLVPMSMALTDATGSGADVVRVSLRKAA